eukprot:Hpha_TRINITY_DN1226_c0_g1::TRINITY_DN1226_c0_g1_i1::g.44887::m.44887
MTAQAHVSIRSNKFLPAVFRWQESAWLQSPAKGVERRMIEREGGERARATTVVRFAPNAEFPAHRHGGGEEFLVLDGVWRDRWGHFPKFSYVRNYIGSQHNPIIGPEGCTILVKLRQMHPSHREPEHVSVDASPSSDDWVEVSPGRFEKVLFTSPHERVSVERWGEGVKATVIIPEGGEEV